MQKTKVGVIYGGMSTEHDVSIMSGTSVVSHLDQSIYDIFPIYIDKFGNWYHYQNTDATYQLGNSIFPTQKIENVFSYLKNLDVVFPVLHGLYGEDGSIQGLLELLQIPYVGCPILASSIAMDKAYTKVIFDRAGIKQANYLYIKALKDGYVLVHKDFSEKFITLDELCDIVQTLHYPIFVKPSNSGSSVGIHKVTSKEELKTAIMDASQFDNKILLEEQIIGREIECAVLGNNIVKSSCLGEIMPADTFYSFDAKYKNSASQTIIPAKLKPTLEKSVQELAIKAFKSIDGKGFSRVDFFVNENTDTIYINEINTIPGFTSISMYPKLWEASGISYSELLTQLISLALESG